MRRVKIGAATDVTANLLVLVDKALERRGVGAQRSEVLTLSAHTLVALYRANVLGTVENPASYLTHFQRKEEMLHEAKKRSICSGEQG